MATSLYNDIMYMEVGRYLVSFLPLFVFIKSIDNRLIISATDGDDGSTRRRCNGLCVCVCVCVFYSGHLVDVYRLFSGMLSIMILIKF